MAGYATYPLLLVVGLCPGTGLRGSCVRFLLHGLCVDVWLWVWVWVGGQLDVCMCVPGLKKKSGLKCVWSLNDTQKSIYLFTGTPPAAATQQPILRPS